MIQKNKTAKLIIEIREFFAYARELFKVFQLQYSELKQAYQRPQFNTEAARNHICLVSALIGAI